MVYRARALSLSLSLSPSVPLPVSLSLSLLANYVVLVLQLQAAAGCVGRTGSGRRCRTVLVDVLDHLAEVVLDGGHGGDDGR